MAHPAETGMAQKIKNYPPTEATKLRFRLPRVLRFFDLIVVKPEVTDGNQVRKMLADIGKDGNIRT